MVFLTFFSGIPFISFQRTLDGNEWERASIRFSRFLTFFPVSGRAGWFWQLPPLIFEECTAYPISLEQFFKECFWLRVASFDAFLVQLKVREILPRLTESRHDRSKKTIWSNLKTNKPLLHNQHCVLRDFLQFSFGRLHNATYPLLLLYFWEGYPSVRYYSRIPYISLSYVFFAISTQGMPEQFFIILRFLRYIDGAYSLGIPHILFFLKSELRWKVRRGNWGDLSGILDGSLACGNPSPKYVKGDPKKTYWGNTF